MLQLDQLTIRLDSAESRSAWRPWRRSRSAEQRPRTRQWQLTLTLDTHGVYALMGKSGSGKSTLLNLIGGFLAPDSGTLNWQGRSLLPLSPYQRPVTTLFQQHNLFDHLSVASNIGLGIDPALRLDQQQHQRIENVLEEVGLGGYAQRRPPSLSGGERQRVALARCLLREQPILLLDEPFSALDRSTRATLMSSLGTLIERQRPLVIMVTHDEHDVAALGAELLLMENGSVRRQTAANRPQMP